MCTISARDFRQNMKALLDRASSGEEVVINRGNEYFLVSKVKVAPVITPELANRLQTARELVAQGEYTELHSHEDIDNWLREL